MFVSCTNQTLRRDRLSNAHTPPVPSLPDLAPSGSRGKPLVGAVAAQLQPYLCFCFLKVLAFMTGHFTHEVKNPHLKLFRGKLLSHRCPSSLSLCVIGHSRVSFCAYLKKRRLFCTLKKYTHRYRPEFSFHVMTRLGSPFPGIQRHLPLSFHSSSESLRGHKYCNLF